MATITVKGGEIFRVPSWNFAISPSAEGYTLNYSADKGRTFQPWDEATEAGKTETVINAPANLFYKLVGNESNVTVTY